MSVFLDIEIAKKVEPIFLGEVPLNRVFRYRKRFYKRINKTQAIATILKDDVWSDFIEIDNHNRTDAVIIGAIIPKASRNKQNKKDKKEESPPEETKQQPLSPESLESLEYSDHPEYVSLYDYFMGGGTDI